MGDRRLHAAFLARQRASPRVRRRLGSPSTGLLRVSGSGSEIRARALLRPYLRPGDCITIEDESYAGDVRLLDVAHEVDTYGGTMTTDIVGRAR